MPQSKRTGQRKSARGRGAREPAQKKSKTTGGAAGAAKATPKAFESHQHLLRLPPAEVALQLWTDFNDGKTDVLNVRVVEQDATDGFRVQTANTKFVNFFTLDSDQRARIITGMDAHHAVAHTIVIASDVVGDASQALVLARQSVSRALENNTLIPTMVDAGATTGPVLASVPAALLEPAAYDDTAWQAAMKVPNPLVGELQAALADEQRQKDEDERAAREEEEAAAAAAKKEEAAARMAKAQAMIDQSMAQLESQRVDVDLAGPGADEDGPSASQSTGSSAGSSSAPSSSGASKVRVKPDPASSTASAFQLQMAHYGGLIGKRPSSPLAGGGERKVAPSVASERATAKSAREADKPAADLPALDLVVMVSKSLSTSVNTLRFINAGTKDGALVVREMKRVKSALAQLKAWTRNPKNAPSVNGSGASASMSKSE